MPGFLEGVRRGFFGYFSHGLVDQAAHAVTLFGKGFRRDPPLRNGKLLGDVDAVTRLVGVALRVWNVGSVIVLTVTRQT